jgi:hypothetical protein
MWTDMMSSTQPEVEEEEEAQFIRLNQASARYWRSPMHAATFRQLLRSASPNNLNRYDEYGWTFLTYVLWSLDCGTETIATLQWLLQSDILQEDHSRLRLDKRIHSDFNGPFDAFFQQSNASASPIEFVKALQKLPAESAFSKKSWKMAENLLQHAINRVSTYPQRLLKTLEQAFFSCFPVVSLYAVIVDYIVWP